MKTYIIDASVVLKWLSDVNEKDTEQAQKIYRKLKGGEIALFAPSFILVEITNILLKKKKLSSKDVTEFITVLLSCGITFIDFSYLKTGALLEISSQFGVTTYDGLYLLLAKEMDVTVVSDDRELVAVSTLVVGLSSMHW